MTPALLALKRRERFEKEIKKYHESKLYVRQPQHAKRTTQLGVGKSPYHSVVGEAYHKYKDGRPFFCGGRFGN
jgi:hypothetical protein